MLRYFDCNRVFYHTPPCVYVFSKRQLEEKIILAPLRLVTRAGEVTALIAPCSSTLKIFVKVLIENRTHVIDIDAQPVCFVQQPASPTINHGEVISNRQTFSWPTHLKSGSFQQIWLQLYKSNQCQINDGWLIEIRLVEEVL